VLGRPDVFVPDVEGAWLHPERATPDEIAELAHNCPSGAIQYQRLDGGPAEAPPPTMGKWRSPAARSQRFRPSFR